MEQLQSAEPLINHGYKLKLRLVHKITSESVNSRRKAAPLMERSPGDS